MNSNNKKAVKCDDDMQFVPLTLHSPFSANNSQWVPLVNIDANSANEITNNFFVGFTPPCTGNILDSGVVSMPALPILPFEEVNNPINISNENKSPSTSEEKPSGSKKVSKNTSNKNNSPTNDTNTNIGKIDLLYPSENPSDELYSYNDSPSGSPSKCVPRTELDDTNDIIVIDDPDLTHMRLLRDYDFSYEELDVFTGRDDKCKNEVDDVFNKIISESPGILAALKAYKVPYPISMLIIKKIIKLTLKICKKE